MEKVNPGDPVEIRAATWNAFVDAANFARGASSNQLGKGLRSGVDVGIVLVKNTASTTYPRFSALVLADVCIGASANEDEFTSCTPVFEGAAMTAQREGMPFAVLLEPVEAGSVGRGMVLGVTPAKVRIASADDEYAVPKSGSSTGELESSSTGVARILWKAGTSGEQWTLLQLGGAGGGAADSALLCRVDGGSAAGGYSVSVYPNGVGDSTDMRSATLYLADVALDGDFPEGTWIVGHKMLLKATGGSDS